MEIIILITLSIILLYIYHAINANNEQINYLKEKNLNATAAAHTKNLRDIEFIKKLVEWGTIGYLLFLIYRYLC